MRNWTLARSHVMGAAALVQRASWFSLIVVCCLVVPEGRTQQRADVFSPKVKSLLSQLTLEEKLSLTDGSKDPADGGEAGYLKGVPRLGIPATRWTDGPGGIDNRYDATNLPQVLAVAATFDRKVSAEFGDVIGREARATRMDVFLGPMVNIARVPNWGRNLTSFGEDPFLTSQLVAPMIRATEAWGVLTTTKHLIANNQALNVNGPHHQPGADFVVDPRTLHEIYLPGFEAAAAAGGGGMMAAYNKINGTQASSNRDLLTGTLRHDLGWNGLVVSDWGAVHEPEAISAGLDVEMPGVGLSELIPGHYGVHLKDAIESGKVPLADLDTAVMRVLTQMERMGMLDGRRVAAPDHVDIEAGARVARSIASRGAVLLKNDEVLPLIDTSTTNASTINASTKRLAVIGPNGGQLAPSQGFGSAYGIEARRVSPLEALRKTAPEGTTITYAVGNDLTGVAIPTSALRVDEKTSGLRRVSLDGTASVVDASLDFVGDNALPQGRGFVWTTQLRAPEDGEYLICIQSWGGGTTLKIDGEQVARAGMTPFGFGIPRKTSSLLPTTDGLDNGQVTLKLVAGRSYSLEVSGQAETESKMQVRLAWVPPGLRRKQVEEAVALARASDTAIVFAWQRGGELATNGENLALAQGQDELIEAVAAANPRTIVVLNTAGPVAMPWKSRVKGVLEMWFPGQEGGWATADLLLGKVNPAGRLPITFPVRAADSPVFAPGHPERYFGTDPQAGPANKVIYSEGIFVGYRYFDEHQIEPLFPFGFGLSYTTFSYSDLKLKVVPDGVDVSFSVMNTGKVEGAEVPQIYVGRPGEPPLAMARDALAGFERVDLAPGQSTMVALHVPVRSLCYWSEMSQDWVVAGGLRTIQIGSSSRDIRLAGKVKIDPPAIHK